MNPLSPHAWEELESLASAPIPASAINAGVNGRLSREGLIEFVMLPSPFKVHKGGACLHARITAAGQAKLAERTAPTTP